MAWNGTDAFGDTVAPGTYQARVQVRGGEYHFIAEDVETSGGAIDNNNPPQSYNPGLTIYQANSATDVSDTTVYWDDLTAGFEGRDAFDATANTPEGVTSGDLTDADGDGKPDGFHTWGRFTANSFGEPAQLIDTYVYGLASARTDVLPGRAPGR